jgi:hypothetical protein
MSLSSSASAQVQAILEAAENSAAEIKREAEAEAEEIRSSARESRQQDLSAVKAAVATLREGIVTLESRLAELEGDKPAAPAPAAAAPKKKAEPAPAPAPAAAPPAKDAAGDDAESARLIALNMALSGESREETDKYLAENFDLGDRSALLDEVYATVEG